MCRSNWLGLQNDFEHCRHVCTNCLLRDVVPSLLPECISTCSARWPCLLNALPHSYISRSCNSQELANRTEQQPMLLLGGTLSSSSSKSFIGSKGICRPKFHFSFDNKCKFRQKFCHKSRISPIFRHPKIGPFSSV